ncbi:MAG: cytochrome c maturation protein CcmE [Gaiellaceae bacterium]
MTSKSHVRLVVALSVAALLAVFLLYSSVAGNATPSLSPSQLPGHHGVVTLAGTVVGPTSGNAHDAPLRFRLRDVSGRGATVPVSYRGEVPDLFKVGRHVLLRGRLHGATFVAQPDSLVTKCPSRYVAQKGSGSDGSSR